MNRRRREFTIGWPFWKRLETRAEGSVGFLAGEKNLEAKYQKTTIRMIPVKLKPPPPCCLPCGAGAAPPPSTTAVGVAMFGRERAMESKI